MQGEFGVAAQEPDVKRPEADAPVRSSTGVSPTHQLHRKPPVGKGRWGLLTPTPLKAWPGASSLAGSGGQNSSVSQMNYQSDDTLTRGKLNDF